VKFAPTAATFAVVVTALACASTAAAVPVAGSSAAEVVSALQNQGYTVQFNEPSTMALSRCTVSGIHGLTVMMMPDGAVMMQINAGTGGVVYVDLSCPNSNN